MGFFTLISIPHIFVLLQIVPVPHMDLEVRVEHSALKKFSRYMLMTDSHEC